jgi:hypothetical protein
MTVRSTNAHVITKPINIMFNQSINFIHANYLYTVSQTKGTSILCPYLSQALTDFQNSFTAVADEIKLLRFIVHCKNCHLSSIKNNVIYAFHIISQDIVATRSGFVVKYINCFNVYLLLNLMLKNFGNRSIFGYMGKSIEVPFLTRSVHSNK